MSGDRCGLHSIEASTACSNSHKLDFERIFRPISPSLGHPLDPHTS